MRKTRTKIKVMFKSKYESKQDLARGSLAVEAAVIYPLFFLIILSACTLGVNLYQEIDEKQEYLKVDGMWEVKNFYRYSAIKETIGDYLDD